MTFKVGQTVFAEVTVIRGNTYTNNEWVHNEWVKARVLSINDDKILIKTRAGFVLEASCGDILPRPTLLWSIREWFSNLRK